MQKPELEFVYEAQGSLGAPIPMGDTVDGTRRIIPIFKGGVSTARSSRVHCWVTRRTGS